jgi:hypothetical protein
VDKIIKHTILLIAGTLLFLSCEKEPVEVVYADLGDMHGVYISCEGNYMYGNASLSFYDSQKNAVYNNIFFARNRAPLGDVAQSMAIHGENLFIVVNNSGKVVVADRETLEFRHAVTGLVSPRYIHFISSDKAYVSDLYAGKITIINPVSFKTLGFIDVSDGINGAAAHSTETFAEADGKIFVACWSFDHRIIVIDPQNDTVSGYITVPAQPKKMVVDKNQKLWVLSDGTYEGAPGGYELPALVRIDPVTLTTEQIFRLNPADKFAGDLHLNPRGDSLYVVAGSLFKMAANSRKFPEIPFLDAGGRLIYSLGVDPDNGDIYLADAIDYMQNAMVYRYTSGGTLIDSFRTGINPGYFLFNKTN